ncbi:hypothetical protein SLA2020_273940 [Shorea laevis]
MSDTARTTGHEGLSTTDCRGARRRGLAFRPTACMSSREANFCPTGPSSLCKEMGLGATMRDTQAGVPLAEA